MRLANPGYALGPSAAVAMLFGCAGSQSPIGAPGAMPQSAMRSQYKVAPPLLYVVNYAGDNVLIYRARAKTPAPIAEISDGISGPGGDCIDSSGTLYVTNEPQNHASYVSEYALGQVHPSKMITMGIDNPAYCAIDGQGNLWVANHYGPHGGNVTEYKKGSRKPYRVITNGLIYPIGTAIDRAGNLYVSNLTLKVYQANVQVYSPGSTSPSRTITRAIESPSGIAVDAASTLYVTNLHQNNVVEYKAGESVPFRTICGCYLNGPADVTVNAKGWLYVTNSVNSTIVEFAPGSTKPSDRKITNGLDSPDAAAYFPPVLP